MCSILRGSSIQAPPYLMETWGDVTLLEQGAVQDLRWREDFAPQWDVTDQVTALQKGSHGPSTVPGGEPGESLIPRELAGERTEPCNQ